jgi:hypothetical protein
LCKNTICANELCGVSLELIPPENLIRFKVGGGIDEHQEQEKIACSKKCKKVAKFGFVLKHGTENESLKAFEAMMRKKTIKRQQHAQTLGNRGLA